MQPTKMEDRPPYVDFETRAIEDRDASIKEGRYMARDVDYCVITPVGSKDRVERIATEWLEKIQNDARNGRFPQEWVDGYRKMYAQWKTGQEIPLDGTPILGWPMVSPAQAKMLCALNVRTVEDLARANDETKQRIGMGAETLKNKAINFLATAEGTGKVAEQLTAMQAKTASLEHQNEILTEQNKLLKAQVAALQPAQASAGNSSEPDETEFSADDLGLTKL